MDSAMGGLGPRALKWTGRSDKGRFRSNNEDSFVGLRFDAAEVQHLGKVGEAITSSMDFAFAVSDGMGGALAGEFASKIAVEQITRLLPRSFQQKAVGMEAGFADVLSELFDQIHKAIAYIGRSYEECAGMETTLSLCWFTPGWMYFGHIGDSRVYYLPARGREIKQLTHDDTHVGWLLRNGKLNERQARSHPGRNVLQKALGGGNQFVEPQVGAVGCEEGDMFLLCTDGLSEGLYPHQILDILRPSSPIAQNANLAHQLVEEALHSASKDNITALVIEVR